jgi:hypothetical protein
MVTASPLMHPRNTHAGVLQNVNSGFSHSEGEFVEEWWSNFCYKKARTFRKVLTIDSTDNQNK